MIGACGTYWINQPEDSKPARSYTLQLRHIRIHFVGYIVGEERKGKFNENYIQDEELMLEYEGRGERVFVSLGITQLTNLEKPPNFLTTELGLT